MNIIVIVIISLRYYCYYCGCSYMITSIYYYFILFYSLLISLSFKFTLKFCNYWFGSVALFNFILQGIK